MRPSKPTAFCTPRSKPPILTCGRSPGKCKRKIAIFKEDWSRAEDCIHKSLELLAVLTCCGWVASPCHGLGLYRSGRVREAQATYGYSPPHGSSLLENRDLRLHFPGERPQVRIGVSSAACKKPSASKVAFFDIS